MGSQKVVWRVGRVSRQPGSVQRRTGRMQQEDRASKDKQHTPQGRRVWLVRAGCPCGGACMGTSNHRQQQQASINSSSKQLGRCEGGRDYYLPQRSACR